MIEAQGIGDDTPVQADITVAANAIVPFRLVHEAVKYIGNGTTNERPVAHKLAIDAVQNRLEIVALAGIFGLHAHQLVPAREQTHGLLVAVGPKVRNEKAHGPTGQHVRYELERTADVCMV